MAAWATRASRRVAESWSDFSAKGPFQEVAGRPKRVEKARAGPYLRRAGGLIYTGGTFRQTWPRRRANSPRFEKCMPTIKFVKEKKEIQVPEGANLRREARGRRRSLPGPSTKSCIVPAWDCAAPAAC